MQLLQWQTKGSFCGQHHSDVCGEYFLEGKNNNDDLISVNYIRNYSQLSTSSTMSRNFRPTFVYQRRRLSNNSVAIEPPNGIKPSNGFQSAISSEVPSLTAQQNVVCVSEREAENERSSPIMGPVECNTVDRVSNAFNANDNCSSSKSNLELSSASLKFESDDAGECSSSGALIDEKETSSRDICISILRSQGLLNRTRQNRDFTEKSSENYCSKSCRVCGRVESTLNMLLCDNCEDVFHVSCYKPHVTVLPVGEWLCGSCLKKKHKMLKDKSAGNSINISNEIVTNRCLASEGELGSLEFMLRDTEPYMSNVRIGDEFQANVPDWSGPIDEECNLIGDSLELGPSDHVNIQGRDCIKPLKLSSIGNWLQCRGIVEGIGEGVDGTICAKWRRAPLFEVQTDAWECFCCVLWDPAHADCAVPQELDTEEVMKQLKYIEMLRPRLASKRRKMDCSKSNGSHDL